MNPDRNNGRKAHEMAPVRPPDAHDLPADPRAPAQTFGRRVAGRLLHWLRGTTRTRARLTLLERINLAPRHTLALIEAEGRHFLVACAADGAASFHPLDESRHDLRPMRSLTSNPDSSPSRRPFAKRVSW
jgi:hypothetical protein